VTGVMMMRACVCHVTQWLGVVMGAFLQNKNHKMVHFCIVSFQPENRRECSVQTSILFATPLHIFGSKKRNWRCNQ
jgi:hypothetical protein